MTTHFYMGAINKITNNYEYPQIANKNNKYKCPSCDKDVIFKKGQIKKPHFSHLKSNEPCFYYNKPNESQIHKDAKMLMKTLLDNKKYIGITRNCKYCTFNCLNINIFEEDYNENTKAIIEYKFIYNDSKKSADVALIENDKIKYIFEICYKNKTNEYNRPEPWVEINAENLINAVNLGKEVKIECIRNFKCEECIAHDEEEKQNLLIYYEKIKQAKLEEEKIREEEKQNDIKRQEELKLKQEKQKLEQLEILKKEAIQKQEELKLKQPCKCGIMILNICKCESPKYEFVKLSNNLFCINCNKWKCRCV